MFQIQVVSLKPVFKTVLSDLLFLLTTIHLICVLPIRRSNEGFPFRNGGCYFGCDSKVSCKSVLTESVDEVTIMYWLRGTQSLKNEDNVPNLTSPLSVRSMFAPWKGKKKPHKFIILT